MTPSAEPENTSSFWRVGPIHKKGRYANKAFCGPSNSGKTYAALREAKRRKVSVYVDVTNTVKHGDVFAGADDIVRLMVGEMGDPRRGGHFTWHARHAYDSGNGDFASGLRAISASMESRDGSSTLILDEVGSITLSSRDSGRGKDKDAIREMVRASKTGHQTQVSAWFVTQRIQELPRHAELEFKTVFGIGDAAERRYYQRETGGWPLVRALDACEAVRRMPNIDVEYPYVSLARCPTLHITEEDTVAAGMAGRVDNASRWPEGYRSRLSPCGRILMCPQHGGGTVPRMTVDQWVRKGE